MQLEPFRQSSLLFGQQRTEINLDANGYLQKITNPAGESVLFETRPDGLLAGRTDPGGGTHE